MGRKVEMFNLKSMQVLWTCPRKEYSRGENFEFLTKAQAGSSRLVKVKPKQLITQAQPGDQPNKPGLIWRKSHQLNKSTKYNSECNPTNLN